QPADVVVNDAIDVREKATDEDAPVGLDNQGANRRVCAGGWSGEVNIQRTIRIEPCEAVAGNVVCERESTDEENDVVRLKRESENIAVEAGVGIESDIGRPGRLEVGLIVYDIELRHLRKAQRSSRRRIGENQANEPISVFKKVVYDWNDERLADFP